MSPADTAVATAYRRWASGDALAAFAALYELFEPTDLRRELCESLAAVPPAPQPAAAPAPVDLRVSLDLAADSACIPDDLDACAELCRDFIDQAIAVPGLAGCVHEAHAALAPLVDDEQPVKVAVLGTFSVGKSSFLNALLGSEVLATGNVPVTAIMTTVRYGQVARALWCDADGGQHERSLHDTVAATDDRSQDDAGPEQVIIELPHPILQRVTFIDTPGLDSGIASHDAALPRIIAEADAVFWVFNATRAGSERERIDLGLANSQTGLTIGFINQIDAVRPKPSRSPERWQRECDGVRATLDKQLGSSVSEWALISARWIGEQDPRGGLNLVHQALDTIAKRRQQIKQDARTGAVRQGARRTIALAALRQAEDRKLATACRQRAAHHSAQLQQLDEDWSEEVLLAKRRGQRVAATPLGQDSAKALLRGLVPRLMDVPQDSELWPGARNIEALGTLLSALQWHSVQCRTRPQLAALWRETVQRLVRLDRIELPRPQWSVPPPLPATRSPIQQFLTRQHPLNRDRLPSQNTLHECRAHADRWRVFERAGDDCDALGQAFVHELVTRSQDWRKQRLAPILRDLFTHFDAIEWDRNTLRNTQALLPPEHPVVHLFTLHADNDDVQRVATGLRDTGIHGVQQAIDHIERARLHKWLRRTLTHDAVVIIGVAVFWLNHTGRLPLRTWVHALLADTPFVHQLVPESLRGVPDLLRALWDWLIALP